MPKDGVLVVKRLSLKQEKSEIQFNLDRHIEEILAGVQMKNTMVTLKFKKSRSSQMTIHNVVMQCLLPSKLLSKLLSMYLSKIFNKRRRSKRHSVPSSLQVVRSLGAGMYEEK
ncbi:hypothetical protein BS333_17150 [Vibrio azureus]|uniref:hypothetical protein n=1 Tax=Vibrio azureus TaxID=512649 RepID=UPI000518CDEB|nr:hypothetical protein [Vibrio azureus]AUI88096.1 hypothetical protein BS333_17150 [Vibrio azureus]